MSRDVEEIETLLTDYAAANLTPSMGHFASGSEDWGALSELTIPLAVGPQIEVLGVDEDSGYDRGPLVMTIKVTEGSEERYFRKDGHWSSYDATEWDGAFYEVEPVTETKTVYKKL